MRTLAVICVLQSVLLIASAGLHVKQNREIRDAYREAEVAQTEAAKVNREHAETLRQWEKWSKEVKKHTDFFVNRIVELIRERDILRCRLFEQATESK